MGFVKINVPKEYLDELCDSMLAWVKKEESLTIPEFLEHKGIGYPFLKYFVKTNANVANTFEYVKSILCNRWIKKAFDAPGLTQHQAKILLRYIRLYDSHGWDMELEYKKQQVIAQQESEIDFITQSYAREKIDGLDREEYDRNIKKRAKK